MNRSKKWLIAGAFIAFTSVAFTVSRYKGFMTADSRGLLLFIISLAAGISSCPAFGFVPDMKSKYYRLLAAAVFFAAPLFSVACVEILNGNFLFDLQDLFWMDNYVFCLAFYILLYGLTSSIRISVFVLQPLFLVFGAVNMYVKAFKGSPFVPMDVGSFTTAASVAGVYEYAIGMEFAFAASLTALLFGFTVHLGLPEHDRIRRFTRHLFLAAGISAAVMFYATDIIVDMGYKPDFFNQLRGYSNKGATVEFMLNTRYMFLSKPDGYEPQEAADAVGETVSAGTVPQIFGGDGSTAEAPGKPDIIVIMDEAFSDLRTVGHFETGDEIMPFIDSLTDNTIKGNVYVSVFGTGTSNTEFEFLTGNSMAFLPAGSNAYQLYIKDRQPGTVSLLQRSGYTSRAFHPYFGDNWNRTQVYDFMDFDDYISFEDIFGEDLAAEYLARSYNMTYIKRKLGEFYHDTDIMLRSYVSDEFDFRYIEQDYEKRDKSRPYFMFNVTMQNHSPYTLYSSELKDGIKLRGLTGNYPLTEQYLALIRRSDDAFRQLLKYFGAKSEPVIILFFGDHQPNIEPEFYDEIMGGDIRKINDETLLNRYKTKFVLWANYDIPEGETDYISANYLRTLLLQIAGADLTKYDGYLAELYRDIPVITAQGCLDARGDYFKTDDTESKWYERLQQYRCIQYNNLIDTDNRDDELFG